MLPVGCFFFLFFFFWRFLEVKTPSPFFFQHQGQDKNWLHMTSTEQTIQIHLVRRLDRLYQFFVMHRWRFSAIFQDWGLIYICRAPKTNFWLDCGFLHVVETYMIWGISILSKENSYRVSPWNTDGLWCLMCFSLHINCFTCQWLDVFVGVLFLVSSDKPQLAVFRRRDGQNPVISW